MVKKNRQRAAPKTESLRADMQDVADANLQSRESSATEQPTAEQSIAEQPSDVLKGTAENYVPIVGVGASADGLDAFRKFLKAMPDESGLAIVLVPHLDPSHESSMVNLLTRQTKIPVCEVEDEMTVQANRVYVIPPNKLLSIKDAVLHLGEAPRSEIAAIDALRSAEYYKVAEELRAILDSTIDAVITINQQGIIVRVNASTVKLFGYSSEELIGQNVSILMTSPDRENHDGYIRRYLETGEARIIGSPREISCRRKDSTVFFGDLTISKVDHLGLFTGLIRDITERRRLQSEILRAVAEEQRRIGQDLHDTAGQDLAGMAYLIKSHMSFLQETCDKETVSDLTKDWLLGRLATIQKISDAIRDLQKQIRTVIRGLSPVDVNGNGLMAALTDLTAGIRQLHHVRCEFHCDPPILVADNQLATHLYRIAQEAINNGLRHGGATEIFVRLERKEADILLTVHDNGCGIDFNHSSENGGFGLQIMAYRASLIGAQFSIHPGENGGTIVSCRLPQAEGDAP